jgi:sugar lactone lactonase YvrE
MKPINLIRNFCRVPALLTILAFFQGCSKSSSNPNPTNTGPSVAIASLSVTSGEYTTPVTIKGTGFSTTIADDKVFFNGVQAAVQAASSTMIYTSVPLAAGTGNVTVTINGTTATGPTFTYQTAEAATLLAGSGNPGSSNGTGAAASFSQDIALAADGSGNVYVADQENQVIRKITSAGAVNTFAGTGNAGYANGSGTAASFNAPAGVATDAAGNIYVADSGNGFIRKITSNGQVSTLTVDGSGNPVAYGKPYFIAADAAGNVFFSDNQGGIIREISTNGAITTVYDGTPTYFTIFGLAVDKSDNVFIEAGTQIDKLTAGSLTAFAGGSTVISGDVNGKGTSAGFEGLHGIAIDGNNNLYVFDSGNEIRMITPAAVVTTFAGPGGGYFTGPVSQVFFAGILSLAVDNSGNVYAGGNYTIRKISIQ